MNQSTKLIKKLKKIAILEKILFLKVTKIISHFDGSNNIFADYKLFKNTKNFTIVSAFPPRRW